VQGFGGKLEAKRSLGELEINGRIILKWIIVNTERCRGMG